MKILVTGASSQIGDRFIDLLIKNRDSFICIENQQKVRKNINFIKADITNIKSLQQANKKLRKIDTLVHIAAYVPRTKEDDSLSKSLEVNALGTSNLLSVLGVNVKKIIYISTIEVYGLQNFKEKIDETILPKPISNYGISKLAGENICESFSKKNNCKTTILRFASIYGYKDEIDRAIPNFIRLALDNKKIILYGENEERDYVHITDATNAIYLATKSNSYGTFNIGSGKGISIRKVAEIIKHQINPSLIISIQKKKKTYSNLVLNISKAERSLKYTPKFFFPENLNEMINLYKR